MANNLITPEAQPYETALKRVRELRRLYQHIALFSVVSVMVLLGEHTVIDKLYGNGITDPEILNWVSWNIRLIPVIWFLVVLIQAICIYARQIKMVFHIKKPQMLRRWEERQIKKFLKEEYAPSSGTSET